MAELTVEQIYEQKVKDFQSTFATEEGKRVLSHISRMCYENESTYVKEAPYDTAFCEGARQIILEIRRLINVKLDKPKQKEAISQE